MAARHDSGTLSVHTVLEVVEGLRWSDPHLGASLAEYALRLAGEDRESRALAEASAVRSLAEVDRVEDVVHRVAPLLADALGGTDRDVAATFLVELAGAAVSLEEHDAARVLVEAVTGAPDLPARLSVAADVVLARLAGARGDLAGADAAGARATEALRRTREPEAGLLRCDLVRARAEALRHAGRPESALALLETIVCAGVPGADGGRRALTAAADAVDLLLEVGRDDTARQRAHEALSTRASGPSVVRAVGRLVTAIGRIGADPSEDQDPEADVRAVAVDLEGAGHEADAARAWECVASMAEARSDLGAALSAVRRGHALDTRARDRRLAARTVLAAAVLQPPRLPPLDRAPTPTVEADLLAADHLADGSPRRVRARADDVDGAASEATAVGSPSVDSAAARAGDTAGSAPSNGPRPPADGVGRAAVPPAVLPAVLPVERPSMPVGAVEPLSELPASGDLSASATGSAEPQAALNGMSRHSAASLPAAPRRTRRERREAQEASRPTFDAFSTAPPRASVGHEPGASTEPPTPRATGVDVPVGHVSGDAPREAVVGSPAAPVHAVVGLETASPEAAASPSDLDAEEVLTSTGAASPSAVPVPPVEPDEPAPMEDGGTVGAPPADRQDAAEGVPTASSVDSARVIGTDGIVGPDGVAADRPAATALEATAAPVSDVSDRSVPDAERPRAAPHDELDGASATAAEEEPPSPPVTPERTAGPSSPREAPGRSLDPEVTPLPPAARRGGPSDEDDELSLTLAGVLAEYHLPDVPAVDHRAAASRGTGLPMPSARRHTSGSMPVPPDDRASNGHPLPGRPAGGTRPGPERHAGDGPYAPTDVPTTHVQDPAVLPAGRVAAPGGRVPGRWGPGRRPESGERLADLLAEAMDAFRHTGPDEGSRSPGVGSRPS